jgi:hypothetical protein
MAKLLHEWTGNEVGLSDIYSLADTVLQTVLRLIFP